MESMEDLEGRIESLRRLLHGESPVPPAPPRAEPKPVKMFEGHRPAHAAPGPLLDELQTPDRLTDRTEAKEPRPEHRPAHAAPSEVTNQDA